MNLYMLTTFGLGDFYVVATTPNDACNLLTEKLYQADYGYDKDRKIHTIHLMCEELYEFNGKPSFSMGNKLLIQKTEKDEKTKI